METAYDNNSSNGASAFSNSNEDIFQKSNLLHDFGLDMNCKGTATGATVTSDNLNNIESHVATDAAEEVDLKPMTAAAAMDFIFGNPAVQSATNGKHDADSVVPAANGDNATGRRSSTDFGPETDVDAVDEPHLKSPVRNPLQEEHEQFFSEFISPGGGVKNNGDGVDVDDFTGEEADAVLPTVQQHNPFAADNKFIDDDEQQQQMFIIDDNKRIDTDSPVLAASEPDTNADADDTNEHVADSAQSLSKRFADFSEKKEFSFEREEYEKEIDSLADLQSAMQPENVVEEIGAERTAAASATSDELLTSLASDTEAIEAVSPVTPPPQLDSSAEDDDGRIDVDGDAVPPTVSAMTVEDLAALTASDDDEDEEEVRRRNALELDAVDVVPVAEHETSVDHLTAAENVAVPESGEDSEDEWNYINVKHEDTNANAISATSPQPTASVTSEQQQHDVEDNDDDDEDRLYENNTAAATELIEVVAPEATSAEPLVDDYEQVDEREEEIIEPETAASPSAVGIAEESHGVLQALVEPQEDFEELSDHTGAPHHEDNSHADESIDAAKQLQLQIDEDAPLATSDASEHVDIDDEDMDFQLNPDAKEFVPTSPLRTPVGSPFHGNGTPAAANPLIRTNLMMDDVIAQSPRKGGVPMENIDVPSENEFDDEIAHRPMELETVGGTGAALLSPTIATTAATNGNGERPGSSGSTYSYQEMNLKEAMHGDEKLEYAPEEALLSPDATQADAAHSDELSAASEPPSSSSEATNDGDGESAEAANQAAAEHASERFLLRESDPMSMSFYNDGSAGLAGNNPFAVDMNAVQLLPQEDDDEDADIVAVVENATDEPQQQVEQLLEPLAESDDLLGGGEQEPSYNFDGVEGQHFVIQDTEFGMNGSTDHVADSPVAEVPPPSSSSGSNFMLPDEISKPEEDQYSPVTDPQLVEEFAAFSESKRSASHDAADEDLLSNGASEEFGANAAVESDRPEADLQQYESSVAAAASSIVQVVQEMATEATSMLADVQLSDELQSPLVADLLLSSPLSDLTGSEDVSEHVTASPVDDVPTDLMAGLKVAASIEELAESEQNYSQQAAIDAAAAAAASEASIIVAEPAISEPIVEPIVEPTVASSDASTVADLMQQTLQPFVGDSIDIDPMVANASVAEAVQKTDADAETVVEAAATRLLTTGTAASPVGAKKTPLKSAPSATTKSSADVKPKVLATKKPIAAATSSARAGTSSVTKSSAPLGSARSTLSTTSSAARPKTLGTTAATSARTASTSTASKPSAIGPAAAKKPLTNGAGTKSASTLLSAAKKPTVTSAVGATRTASTTSARTATTSTAAAKPSVAARSTAATTRPLTASSTLKSTSTTSASSSSTVTKTTTKSTTTTRAPISSRTTTATNVTSSSTSTLKPARLSTTAAAPISRPSPIKSTTAAAADKTTKDATNKLSSTTRTSTLASPRTATALKKTSTVDINKSPSVRQATATRTTVGAPASLTKRPTAAGTTTTTTAAAAAARKPTLSSRVSLAPSATAAAKRPTTSASPIKKRVSAPTKSVSSTATAVPANGVAPLNGTAAATTIIAGDDLTVKGTQLHRVDGEEKFDVSKQLLNNGGDAHPHTNADSTTAAPTAIIDLAAD